MQQSTLDPHIQEIIANAGKFLHRALPAAQLADGSWQLDDSTTLHFEDGRDDLLIVLRMPEKHLDAHQLTQLLMLGGQDWPVPLTASLSGDEAQALLFTRLRMSALDQDRLMQAVLILLQARTRWLQAPAANAGKPRHNRRAGGAL
ncbi:MAG: hypothetical protein JWQ10_3869 [Herbaspirillum sp.]|nr:hypothetical protein [Herbaspirillum sp.]